MNVFSSQRNVVGGPTHGRMTSLKNFGIGFMIIRTRTWKDNMDMQLSPCVPEHLSIYWPPNPNRPPLNERKFCNEINDMNGELRNRDQDPDRCTLK